MKEGIFDDVSNNKKALAKNAKTGKKMSSTMGKFYT
jgi:hypothetical protein